MLLYMHICIHTIYMSNIKSICQTYNGYVTYTPTRIHLYNCINMINFRLLDNIIIFDKTTDIKILIIRNVNYIRYIFIFL